MRTPQLLQTIFIVALVVLAVAGLFAAYVYFLFSLSTDPMSSLILELSIANLVRTVAWIVAVVCVLDGLRLVLVRSRPTGIPTPTVALLVAILGAVLQSLSPVADALGVGVPPFGGGLVIGAVGSTLFVLGLGIAVLWDPSLR